MSSVLVFGAGGYIGSHVAYALRDAGYRVYGVIRKPDAAARLLQNEILPIVTDIKNPSEEFKNAIKESISIIDTSGTDADLLKFVLELNKEHKNRNYQHQYISTSGLLVYPDSAAFATERTPPVIPPDFPIPQLVERARFEELLVTSEHVRGNIIRPGVVYGLDGNTGGNLPRHLVRVFGLKPNDDLVIYGQRHKEVGWVHVKDLAAAYVLLVNSGVHGKIYNIAAESLVHEQVHLSAAKAAGWTGSIKYVESKDIPPTQFFDKLGDKSVRSIGDKARRELNWQPKRVGFLHELDVYYRAFIAQRESVHH